MKLVVLDGPMRGAEYRITQPQMVVGRKREADIALTHDSRISRSHCRLTYENGRYYLEDLGSGNGTFLGNVRLQDKVHLPTDQVFRLGRTHLALREESEADIRRAAQEAVAFVGDEQLAEKLSERETLDPKAARADWTAARADDDAATKDLRQRLRLFHEVSWALSGKLDLPSLLDAIMDSLIKAVPAERGFLMLADEKGKQLTPTVVRKRGPEEDEEVKVSTSIVAKAMEEHMSVLSADAMADERFSAQDSVVDFQLRSVICAPLIHQDRALGAIILDNRSAARMFSYEDLQVVTDIANQAAIALANAKLYTDLRNAYEELQAAQERLVQSEKLTVIGTLSASIAHDIANLITPISVVAAMAASQGEVDPELQETVERQTGRLRALTRQLMSFSKTQELKREPTDVNAAVEGSASMMRTEAKRAEVEIVRELADGMPEIMADPDQLDQVFVNLILNAIQAMSDGGGTLTIATGLVEGCVEVSFADDGPGIPAEVTPRLFEAFYTTKGDEGTGLGLFSCKRIIEEEHGGTLSVESELGVGTTFTIRFPESAIVAPC
ncbi:MAG: ATP-binding protein [Armatimonadota bacterium]